MGRGHVIKEGKNRGMEGQRREGRGSTRVDGLRNVKVEGKGEWMDK